MVFKSPNICEQIDAMGKKHPTKEWNTGKTQTSQLLHNSKITKK